MATTKSKPAKTTQARNRPAISSPRQIAGSDTIQLPEDRMVDIAQTITGDLQSIRNNNGNIGKFIADEAFMKELLLITINPPGDNENPIAQVIVNNRAYDIPRGRMVRVPRYVVEALAHAKQATFRTKRTFIGDQNHMKPIEQHTWSFPFGVQHDPSGAKGQQWFERVMSDPN